MERESFVLSSDTILKEGILYKQRDHFKGWRSRYFTLDNIFLHYYLSKNDDTPRKSIQICKGVIVRAIEPKTVNGQLYYPFVISHPRTSTHYKLSTVSRSDCESWIRALTDVANSSKSTVTEIYSSEEDGRRNGSCDGSTESLLDDSSEDEEEPSSPTSPVSKKKTLRNIPDGLSVKIETAVSTLLEGSSEDDDGWQPMFEKPGRVVATRKSGAGTICVRGVAVLPYTIPEIYSVLSERRKELDPQLNTYTRLKWFSRHTGVEYLRFKPVWPTAARDFCNLTHWRLLRDGTFITLGFSEPFPICPEEKGVVRAQLIIGGYVMKPVAGGTHVTILVQSDLRGTLPASVQSLAAQSQPLVLLTLRKVLDKIHDGKSRSDISQPVIPSYEDMMVIVERNANPAVPYEDDAPQRKLTLSQRTVGSVNPDPMDTNRTPQNVPSVTSPQSNNESSTMFYFISTLLICVAIYFAIDENIGDNITWGLYIAALLLAMEVMLQSHLYQPSRRVYSTPSRVTPGNFFFRFRIDSPRRSSSGTMSHVIVKALAKAIEDCGLNGHVIFGKFYPLRSAGVDISVSADIDAGSSTMVTVRSANSMTAEGIAADIGSKTAASRNSAEAMSSLLPFTFALIWQLFALFSNKYGLRLSIFEDAFPNGVGTVFVTDSQENDIVVSLVPNTGELSTPIAVIIDGNEATLTVNSRAASIKEGKRLVLRFKELLRQSN